MADLGFLPVVRRLLDQTPRSGPAAAVLGDPRRRGRRAGAAVPHQPGHPQRRLGAVAGRRDVPPRAARHATTTGCRCWSTSPPRPGRTLVFTRTKRGAKALTRQLVAAGVPAVELHGNLAQNARSRNLRAFSDGSATHAGRDRHRGPRHPRRRRHAGHPRRSAGRAQGVPAPLRPDGPRRRARHGGHADDRRPGRRRPRPDPQGGHHADDHAAAARPSAARPNSLPASGPSSHHRHTRRRASRHHALEDHVGARGRERRPGPAPRVRGRRREPVLASASPRPPRPPRGAAAQRHSPPDPAPADAASSPWVGGRTRRRASAAAARRPSRSRPRSGPSRPGLSGGCPS